MSLLVANEDEIHGQSQGKPQPQAIATRSHRCSHRAEAIVSKLQRIPMHRKPQAQKAQGTSNQKQLIVREHGCVARRKPKLRNYG